jgi:hypothetical protein
MLPKLQVLTYKFYNKQLFYSTNGNRGKRSGMIYGKIPSDQLKITHNQETL